MPSECVFEFDRPVPIYYSGETINGRISLTTTSAKSVNVVYILFEGQGKVHWEKRRSSGKNSYTEHFRSFESYFNNRTNVFGEGELPPGTHTYTFCIPLPLECPTSCVERYGKISYEVSLVVDRPWRFNNVFKRPITVLQTYNLNMYADLLLPLKNEDVKYLCCWPCSAGPIISTLTIPFGGYAPGQKINYTLCIDNQSNGNDLEGIKITLLQKYIFRATSPRQKFKEHINALATESQDQRVLRLSKREINASLLIPPVPPSTRSNRIINIYYSILMTIRTGACHKASEIEIPITIGTIPLAQSAVNPATAAQWIPQTPDTPAGAAADLPPSYDNCRPPSFETSTHIGEKFIDTEVNEHHRTDDFIPHYPMYTNFSAPTAPPPETSDAPLLQQPHNPSANSQFN